jgi:hypothetical protein
MVTLSSKLFGRKNLFSSPIVLTAMILAGLLPLIIIYFFLIQAGYWNYWNIPLSSQLINIVSQVLGIYALGGYCLIVLAVTAFSFRPFKFDPLLFVIRFAGRIIQLLFVIDFIILLLSPLIWVSFILVITAALSYFIMEAAKFRLRFRIRDETEISEISRDTEQITLPADGAFEILVAGTGIDKFSVNIEQAGGSTDNKYLTKTSSENQWEISNLSLNHDQDLPCTALVLHVKDQIRRFKLSGEPSDWLKRIRVELIVNSDIVLKDGELNFEMSDAKPLMKLVEKTYEKYQDYFPSQDLSSVKVYAFKDDRSLSPKLSLQKSIRKNGIIDNQKIRIEL